MSNSIYSIRKDLKGSPICKEGLSINDGCNGLVLSELQIQELKITMLKNELSYLYGQDSVPKSYKKSIYKVLNYN